MDILATAGLETEAEQHFRQLANGAVIRPPMSWAEFGFAIQKKAGS